MNTISRYPKLVKGLIDPRCHKGVYLISCSCGKPYIGEIGWYILTIIQEHVADIKHNRLKTSALAEHSDKTSHHICIENSRVLAKIDHYYHRKFREAIEIKKWMGDLNKEDGWIINKNWITTLISRFDFSYSFALISILVINYIHIVFPMNTWFTFII